MAILFDLDGVLIDSFELHQRVWQQWALGHGLDPTPVFEATFGRRPVDTIQTVAGHLMPEEELARLDALLDAEADAVSLQPGALEAVRCASLGPWAVVTSTEQRRARAYPTRLSCSVPEIVIGGTDVRNGKPAPDGYLAAAEQLDVPRPASSLRTHRPASKPRSRLERPWLRWRLPVLHPN